MILPIIFLFILGAAFGSFLSVVIHRIHKEKKGIFFGKSECPNCHKKLKALEMIPVFSYIIHKAKCKKCNVLISPHYLMIEILTGLMFVGFYFLYPFITIDAEVIFVQNLLLMYLYFVVVGLFLIGILFYDLRHMQIPEIFTLPAIALIFIVGIFLPEPGIYDMIIGGAIAGIFFGLQVWISKEKWLGAGDTQVGVLMGLLFGWQLFIVALIATYLLGSIISIALLTSRKFTMKSKIPFAPFMVLGTFVTIFFGEYILNLYLSTLL